MDRCPTGSPPPRLVVGAGRCFTSFLPRSCDDRGCGGVRLAHFGSLFSYQRSPVKGPASAGDSEGPPSELVRNHLSISFEANAPPACPVTLAGAPRTC